MKINPRQLAKIAGIMVASGVGICAIALMGGAKPNITIINGEVVLSNPFQERHTREIFKSNQEIQEKGEENQQVREIAAVVEGNREYINVKESLKAFKDVDVSVDTMDVNILVGEAYQIEARYEENTKFGYEVRGDELVIEQIDHSEWNKQKHGKRKGYVNIYIPKNEVIKYADIAMGMGGNVIENLEIQELELACGMGSVELKNVIMDTAYIDGGMGSITGKDLVSNNLEINMGMGNVDIRGDLKGKIDIEGGMGELKIITTGRESDYNYDISKGMGIITINGKTQGLLEDVRVNNKAANDIIIDGGMGTIHVKTE